jgi:hypothetical protein
MQLSDFPRFAFFFFCLPHQDMIVIFEISIQMDWDELYMIVASQLQDYFQLPDFQS